jgi:hypothetical protein
VRRTFFCACTERLGRLLLPITLALVIASAPAARADDQPSGPKIDFVDSSAMTIAPEPDGTFSTDVALKNTGKEAGRADIVLKNEACSKTGKAAFENEVNIKEGEFAIAKLKISGVDLPKTCYVELQTLKEKEQSVVARSLKQFKLSQIFVTWWLAYGLIAAFLVSLVATGMASEHVVANSDKVPPIRLKLGSPAWDFTKSWTSTLTLAGGVLSAVLTLSALPEMTQYASKPGYGTLILLFSLLVLFAPLVFMGWMSGDVKHGTDGKPSVTYQGNGLLFFITCLMTLTGGLGQVAVLALLLDEVFGKMYSPFYIIALVFVAVFWLLISSYSINSMKLTFKLEKTPPKAVSPPKTSESTDDTRGPTAQPVDAGRPSWPLL